MANVAAEARDSRGRWTAGGATAPDPRAVEVGGDEWNKQIAAKLENQYAAALPALNALAEQATNHTLTPLQSAEKKATHYTTEALTGPKATVLTDDEEKALVGKYGSVQNASVALMGGGEDLHEDEDEEPSSPPEEWEELSGDDQQTAEEEWKKDHYDSYLESEKDSWLKNDGAAEAGDKAAHDDDWKAEWLTDYLADRIKDGEPRIPYTAEQLQKAIKIDFDRNNASGYTMNALQNKEYGTDVLDINFDDDELKEPDNAIKGQTLPGIAPQGESAALTKEMRDDITENLTDAFWNQAKTEYDHLTPPDYLDESTNENLDSVWGDMDDSAKFEYAQDNTEVLKNYEQETGITPNTGPITMPEKFDPLNETSGEDYKKTQRLAKYMADHRAEQIMAERGIAPNIEKGLVPTQVVQLPEFNNKWGWANSSGLYLHNGGYDTKEEAEANKPKIDTTVSLGDIQSADERLWSGWKGSSTGSEGRILQVAAADELGGRLRDALQPNAPVSAVGTPEYQKFAKSDVAEIGDLDEFKAALKASSDPPGMAQAVKYDPDMSHEQKQKAQEVLDESLTGGQSGPQVLKSETVMTGGSDPNAPPFPFTLLPTVNVMRNGAASMTTDRTVANNWRGTPLKAAQISPEEAMLQANNTFKSIGGYAGVKAAVRAKWETTQYLLDRADIPVVQAYRGINMPHIIGEKQTGDFLPPLSGKVFVPAEGVDKDLAKEPIGSTFTTNSGKIITKVSDSNKDYDYPKVGQWKYDQPPSPKKSVVLRAEVPRTAVLSVPAYGQNIHSEHEVVVAGTGWKGWDAWSGSAPSFKDIPMGTHTPSANAGEPTPDNEAYKSISPKETAELDKTVSELKGSKKAAAA